MDCIFCKIISGEIPSSKVYEDDQVFAFNDIQPTAPIHILIIPKEHIESAADINEKNSNIVAHIFEVAAQITKDMNLSDGFRIVTNTGISAGQSVKHLHFHLLAGREFSWPAG